MTIKDIIKLLQSMKKGHKLCGKGYDSCSTCPYGDKDCEGNKYYNLALAEVISALSKITDKESEYRVALEKIEADVSWGDHHDRAEYESQLRKIWDIASKALKVTKEECI